MYRLGGTKLIVFGCLLACWMLLGCGGGGDSTVESSGSTTEAAIAPSASEVEDCLREGGAKVLGESNATELAAEGPGGGFIAINFYDDAAEGMEFAEGIDGKEGVPGAGERVVSTVEGGRIVISLSLSPSMADENLAADCTGG